MTVVGAEVLVFVLSFFLCAWYAAIPGTLTIYNLWKEKEHVNFIMADNIGALSRCVD